MGGWIFILPAAAMTLLLGQGLGLARVAAITMLAYAVIGFLDDFLKIKRHDNGGLRPYQKIISQLGIASVLVWYVWRSHLLGGWVYVPFYRAVDIGYWVLPLVALVFVAGTNAVNLTDGLDGLAASTSIVYMGGAAVMVALLAHSGDAEMAAALGDLNVFCACMMGGLAAYLVCNASPARVFMGDTGSMALGGAVCCISVFSRTSLYLPILGIMYVVSCITVIVQVGYFKLTGGKRIFLMAPLHHHLQRKGYSESRVCALYAALTLLAAAICVAGVYTGWYGLEQ